jgi:hypothetical protein
MNPRYTAVRSARRSAADYAVDLRQWRVWRDGEGDGAQTTPTDTQPDKSGAQGNGGQAAMIAQEKANELIGAARKDGRTKGHEEGSAAARKALLPDGLQMTDEEIKQALADVHKAREAAKTDLDRAQGDLKAATEDRDNWKAKYEELVTSTRLDRRDNAIKDALRGAGVVDDKDNPRVARVMTLLKAERQADVEAVLKEDGTVDEKKLETLITAARSAYADYFKGGRFVPGTGSHSGGRTVEPGKEAKDRARQQVKERQRSGW